MEKKSKKGILALVLLSALFVVGFFIMKYQRQNTLTVGIFTGSNWNVPGSDYSVLFEQAIQKFQQEYPQIRVKYEEGIRAEDYSEWLAGEMLKGTEPDVFLVPEKDFSLFARTGALQALDEKIFTDDTFAEEEFYAPAYEAGQQGQKQYALPFASNPSMMFVNKTILKEEGIALPSDDWTWDDFYRICAQVTKDVDGDGSLDQFGSCGYDWQHAVYSNGANPFDAEGTTSYFTEANVVDSIAFVKQLNELYGNFTVTSQDFDLGKVAFQPMAFSEYRTYMPYPWRIKKYTAFEWNCIAMPAGPEGENTARIDTLLLGMSARTTKSAMAWKFMKLLTTDPEIQTYIYKNTAGASPLIETTCSKEVMQLLNEGTPGDDEINVALLDQVMKHGIALYTFETYDTAIQYADYEIEAFLRSDDEMNLAMYHLKNELQKILNQK